MISFDEATAAEGYEVHSYQLTVFDDRSLPVFADTFINDYYVFDEDDTADCRIPGDKLKEGKSYTLSVIAESAYYKRSTPIKLAFTAE